MPEKKIRQVPAVLAGLSGLQVPVPKYLFPREHKESSRLTYYSTFFNSIEINSTFYKLPQQRTITNWINSVPPEFKFTFKLWKEITHCKHLDFKESDVEKFFTIINTGAEKKGCVLVQFPPGLSGVHIGQVSLLLSNIQKHNRAEWPIAVEFRNKSWYNSSAYELLASQGIALVIHDIPKSFTPMVEHTTNFIYVRFHGPTGNYRDSYPDSFLYEYATYVKEWVEEGKTVYLYFNNTMGAAFQNLQTLQNAIRSGI